MSRRYPFGPPMTTARLRRYKAPYQVALLKRMAEIYRRDQLPENADACEAGADALAAALEMQVRDLAKRRAAAEARKAGA